MFGEVEHMLEALRSLHALTEVPVRMSGLRKGEFGAMIILDQSKALESNPDTLGLTVSELSRALNISPAGVSQMVNSLVSKGYAVRVPDAQDRRVVRLLLTRRGEKLAVCARDAMGELAGRILSRMGDEDASRFVQYLDQARCILAEEIGDLRTQTVGCPREPAQRKEFRCEST